MNNSLPPLVDSFIPPASIEWDNKIVRQFKKGEIVYIKSICGPIIKTTVVEQNKYGFTGTIDAEDCKRLFLAGTPEYPQNYVSMFFESSITTQECYDNEDKTQHIIRLQKKPRKKSHN